MDERRWKVGELADATGLTVRALHHFDEIGLLRPATRSQAGHRLYTADDVRRLYQIIALRQLGMPLRGIIQALDGHVDDLARAIDRQLEHVDQVISRQHQVRRRVLAIRRGIHQAQQPSIDQLIDAMEAIMHAGYFTPDQLARARQRHQEPGFAETFSDWQVRCAHLVDEIKAEIQRGTDPADPAAQALARRWNETMQEMIGDDRQILSAIYAKIDGKGPEAATHGVLDAIAWDYLKRAFAVGYGHHR
ncbi:MerR family transcriptional regulator [Pseudonocardia sp. CA-142604]|uniref:MerR family transcriptional regulator n=1 Tax=Pseudonocardia sp. CA-142604 TaxID=3240024 RepID=UPI003D947471